MLDLGTIYAGPYAGMLLSDLGANVIKVEPLDGDPWRAFAFGFLGANRGKRGLAVNLKQPDGLEMFYDLVRKADVVCDNFRAGVLSRLKIDHATLSRMNPRIVSCSITPFGSSGPMAGLPGFDPVLQARSGLMRAQGGEGQEPIYHQIAVSDFTAALLAAFGVIGALLVREQTGRGQLVETSLAGGGDGGAGGGVHALRRTASGRARRAQSDRRVGAASLLSVRRRLGVPGRGRSVGGASVA